MMPISANIKLKELTDEINKIDDADEKIAAMLTAVIALPTVTGYDAAGILEYASNWCKEDKGKMLIDGFNKAMEELGKMMGGEE